MKTILKKSIGKSKFLLAMLSFVVYHSISMAQTSWNTNGNVGSFSNFIGTTNNYPFLFRTNNVERFRIQPNGFVGIGVANPTQRLDVFGNLRVRGNIYVDQNVYQQGQFDADSIDAGLINASNLNANYVNTDSLKAYVIMMEEQSKFVGQTNFENSVKVSDKLVIGEGENTEESEKFEVRNGKAKFFGDVKLNQRLIFGDGNYGISFIQSNSSDATNSFLFGPPDNQYADNPFPCSYPIVNTSVDFRDRIRVYGGSAYNGGSRHTISMFCDGGNGNIDFAGTNGNSVGDPSLLINYYCGKDIHAVTGVNGGKLVVGKPQNNELAFNVRGNSIFEGSIAIGDIPVSSEYKLDVAGAFNASDIFLNGVRLASGWAQATNSINNICFAPGNVGIKNCNPITPLQINIERSLTFGNTGGTGANLFGEFIGFNARYNPEGASTFYKLSGPQHGGSIISGAYDGTLQIQTFNAQSNNEVNTGFRPQFKFTPNGEFDLFDESHTMRMTSSNGTGRIINDKSLTVFLDQNNDNNDEMFSILTNSYWWDNQGNVKTLFDIDANGHARFFARNYTGNEQPVISVFNRDGGAAVKITQNGDIYCRHLRVTQNSFPDYVFAENYPLKSLEDIESFIKVEKHLPNMPSEKEVIENGMDVTKIVTENTASIEQIYLYLISLNKKVKDLESENMRLNKLLKK